MPLQLALTTLVAREYDEAIRWFTTMLDFTLVEDAPREGGKRWVVLRPGSGGSGLLIARAANAAQAERVGAQTGGRVAFFLTTDDFDRDHARFKGRGVPFTEGPRTEPYGKVAVFTDLYGNRWDLVERRESIPQAEYDIEEALALLTRTPEVLRALLAGLPAAWTDAREGAGSWSAYDIVGHLIHGERTDWIPRTEHILAHGGAVPFPPFDREAMLHDSEHRSLPDLLAEFARLRAGSLERLRALDLTGADLERPGLHPALGPVALRHHLSSWVVHDLGHLAQIARVMAKRYRRGVGPWRAYLPILDR